MIDASRRYGTAIPAIREAMVSVPDAAERSTSNKYFTGRSTRLRVTLSTGIRKAVQIASVSLPAVTVIYRSLLQRSGQHRSPRIS